MILQRLTPPFMQCVIGACSEVYGTDRDTYIIIGKVLDKKTVEEFLPGKVGATEIAIEVPKALLQSMESASTPSR